jgi:hypothetical protein
MPAAPEKGVGRHKQQPFDQNPAAGLWFCEVKPIPMSETTVGHKIMTQVLSVDFIIMQVCAGQLCVPHDTTDKVQPLLLVYTGTYTGL